MKDDPRACLEKRTRDRSKAPVRGPSAPER